MKRRRFGRLSPYYGINVDPIDRPTPQTFSTTLPVLLYIYYIY